MHAVNKSFVLIDHLDSFVLAYPLLRNCCARLFHLPSLARSLNYCIGSVFPSSMHLLVTVDVFSFVSLVCFLAHVVRLSTSVFRSTDKSLSSLWL